MRKNLLIPLIVCAGAGIFTIGALIIHQRQPVIPPVSAHEGKVTGKIVGVPGSVSKSGVTRQQSILKSGSRKSTIMEKVQGLKLSEAVREVVGLVPDKKDYLSRMQALRKLPLSLSADDVAALRVFLESRFKDQREFRLLVFNGLKNDVLDIIFRQDKMPDGLGQQLVTMYRDQEHDDVWRDYCIQYLAPYYDAKWPVLIPPEEIAGSVRENVKGSPASAESDDDPEREEIEDAYWEAIAAKDKTVAGTALMALERLSRNHTEIDRKKVEEKALALARDDACLEASKITALRVCALMGQKEALPTARTIVQTGETVTLRMAAIATIGDLGNEDDIKYLESMKGSPERRIRTTAESALKRLNERLQDEI